MPSRHRRPALALSAALPLLSSLAPPAVALIAAGAVLAPRPAAAQTLQEALAHAYANNPTLLAARAQLRATDENVPQALAGWRPTVVIGAAAASRCSPPASPAAARPPGWTRTAT
jgi:outer membrane protein